MLFSATIPEELSNFAKVLFISLTEKRKLLTNYDSILKGGFQFRAEKKSTRNLKKIVIIVSCRKNNYKKITGSYTVT